MTRRKRVDIFVDEYSWLVTEYFPYRTARLCHTLCHLKPSQINALIQTIKGSDIEDNHCIYGLVDLNLDVANIHTFYISVSDGMYTLGTDVVEDGDYN